MNINSNEVSNMHESPQLSGIICYGYFLFIKSLKIKYMKRIEISEDWLKSQNFEKINNVFWLKLEKHNIWVHGNAFGHWNTGISQCQSSIEIGDLVYIDEIISLKNLLSVNHWNN